MEREELLNHVMNRACGCCGRVGLTLDGDGVCNTCWDTAAEEAAEEEAVTNDERAAYLEGLRHDFDYRN